MRIRSDSARDLTNGDCFESIFQPVDISLRFCIPEREFQSERDLLGMDPVGTTNHRRVLELVCPLRKGWLQRSQVLQQQFRRLLHLNRQGGVKHIGRGHAKMDEPRFRSHVLTDIGEERDHIMLHFVFDFKNSRDIELRLGPYDVDGFAWDYAKLRLRLAGEDFDFKPDTKLVFVFPNLAHFWACIARDQGSFVPAYEDFCSSVNSTSRIFFSR